MVDFRADVQNMMQLEWLFFRGLQFFTGNFEIELSQKFPFLILTSHNGMSVYLSACLSACLSV